MSTKFFTNKPENNLIDKFKGVFENQPIHFFDALVGYFRASGYFKIRPYLNEVPEIRILVGINVDKLIADAKNRGAIYFENRTQTKENYFNFLKKDIAGANYDAETEAGMLQFIDDIVSKKVTIKAHGNKNLHAKVYIFRPQNFNEHTAGSVITGSSNLTEAGLGTHQNANYEFNVLLRDYDDVKFANDEFERLWDEATEILPEEIETLKNETHLNENITPYELYQKMLVEYFGDSEVLNYKSGELPKGYADLEYQADAVAEGLGKLMKHKGLILADVVGLGKTVIATRIIKEYIIKNGGDTRILIVYPNTVAHNWQSTVQNFKIKDYVHFVSNGSLQKVIEEKENYLGAGRYDLIVVDESHKFRTNTSNRYDDLQNICKRNRTHIGSDKDPHKKVLLLSATPLNNQPEDIANQLYLFQDRRKSTIEGVSNLEKFFAPKIKAYKALNKIKKQEKITKKVKKIYQPIKEKILSELVIRRTRNDIQNIPRYKKDMETQKMSFPTVMPIEKVAYDFDEATAKLFYETMEDLIVNIVYHRYQAIHYLNAEHQKNYTNAENVAMHLYGIIKTGMVKRLESSFEAFQKSLERFCNSNGRMIEMFEKDAVMIAPDLNVNKFLDEGKEDELLEKIEKLNEQDPKNKIYKACDFREGFLEGLQKDQEILDALLEKWKKINHDPKFEKLKNDLENVFMGADNKEKKLVIFSESKETVKYLSEKLKKAGYEDVLQISSDNAQKTSTTILENFDANFDKAPKNNYNIIITTEVLAEGINLHRSNVILNYDIPWNATKLMQRIGRVNRIGTKADKILIYNFYPEKQVNEHLKLNQKALKKLQGFHATFGEDNQIYSEKEVLIKNTLGNLEAAEKETDERLLYLEIVRDLYKNHQKEYDRLKKLPLKIRTGRLAKTKNETAQKTINQPLENTAICFLRNDYKNCFHLCDDEKCVELSFLEAVKLFEATENEKSEQLLKNHFELIKKALNNFETNYQKIKTKKIDEKKLSPKAKKVLSFLKGLLKMKKTYPNEITDAFEERLKMTIDAFYKGTFSNLGKAIYKIAQEKKSINDIAEVVQKINAVMEKYGIGKNKPTQTKKSEVNKNATPKIVLTETFM